MHAMHRGQQWQRKHKYMYSKQQPKTRAAVARIPEVEAGESGVVIG